MKFKKGKYYKHTTGQMLHMLGYVKTSGYGKTILAEEFSTWKIIQCGMDKYSSQNYKKIKKNEWNKKLQELNK